MGNIEGVNNNSKFNLGSQPSSSEPFDASIPEKAQLVEVEKQKPAPETVQNAEETKSPKKNAERLFLGKRPQSPAEPRRFQPQPLSPRQSQPQPSYFGMLKNFAFGKAADVATSIVTSRKNVLSGITHGAVYLSTKNFNGPALIEQKREETQKKIGTNRGQPHEFVTLQHLVSETVSTKAAELIRSYLDDKEKVAAEFPDTMAAIKKVLDTPEKESNVVNTAKELVANHNEKLTQYLEINLLGFFDNILAVTCAMAAGKIEACETQANLESMYRVNLVEEGVENFAELLSPFFTEENKQTFISASSEERTRLIYDMLVNPLLDLCLPNGAKDLVLPELNVYLWKSEFDNQLYEIVQDVLQVKFRKFIEDIWLADHSANSQFLKQPGGQVITDMLSAALDYIPAFIFAKSQPVQPKGEKSIGEMVTEHLVGSNEEKSSVKKWINSRLSHFSDMTNPKYHHTTEAISFVKQYLISFLGDAIAILAGIDPKNPSSDDIVISLVAGIADLLNTFIAKNESELRAIEALKNGAAKQKHLQQLLEKFVDVIYLKLGIVPETELENHGSAAANGDLKLPIPRILLPMLIGQKATIVELIRTQYNALTNDGQNKLLTGQLFTGSELLDLFFPLQKEQRFEDCFLPIIEVAGTAANEKINTIAASVSESVEKSASDLPNAAGFVYALKELVGAWIKELIPNTFSTGNETFAKFFDRIQILLDQQLAYSWGKLAHPQYGSDLGGVSMTLMDLLTGFFKKNWLRFKTIQKMPEGTKQDKKAKEIANKQLFGELSQVILAKAGLDASNPILPSFLRSLVSSKLGDALTDLLSSHLVDFAKGNDLSQMSFDKDFEFFLEAMLPIPRNFGLDYLSKVQGGKIFDGLVSNGLETVKTKIAAAENVSGDKIVDDALTVVKESLMPQEKSDKEALENLSIFFNVKKLLLPKLKPFISKFIDSSKNLSNPLSQRMWKYIDGYAESFLGHVLATLFGNDPAVDFSKLSAAEKAKVNQQSLMTALKKVIPVIKSLVLDMPGLLPKLQAIQERINKLPAPSEDEDKKIAEQRSTLIAKQEELIKPYAKMLLELLGLDYDHIPLNVFMKKMLYPKIEQALAGFLLDASTKFMAWHNKKDELKAQLAKDFQEQLGTKYPVHHAATGSEFLGDFVAQFGAHFLHMNKEDGAESAVEAILENEDLKGTALGSFLADNKEGLNQILLSIFKEMGDVGNQEMVDLWYGIGKFTESAFLVLFSELSKEMKKDPELFLKWMMDVVPQLSMIFGIMLAEKKIEKVDSIEKVDDVEFRSALGALRNMAFVEDPSMDPKEREALRIEHFYQPLADNVLRLMKLATNTRGSVQIREGADLAFPSPLKDLLWDVARTQLPGVLQGILDSAIEKDSLRSIWMNVLKSADESLRAPIEPAQPQIVAQKDPREEQLAADLGALISNLLQLIPQTDRPWLIKKLVGMSKETLGHLVLDQLKQWNMHKIIDEAIMSGLPSLLRLDIEGVFEGPKGNERLVMRDKNTKQELPHHVYRNEFKMPEAYADVFTKLEKMTLPQKLVEIDRLYAAHLETLRLLNVAVNDALLGALPQNIDDVGADDPFLKALSAYKANCRHYYIFDLPRTEAEKLAAEEAKAKEKAYVDSSIKPSFFNVIGAVIGRAAKILDEKLSTGIKVIDVVLKFILKDVIGLFLLLVFSPILYPLWLLAQRWEGRLSDSLENFMSTNEKLEAVFYPVVNDIVDKLVDGMNTTEIALA